MNVLLFCVIALAACVLLSEGLLRLARRVGDERWAARFRKSFLTDAVLCLAFIALYAVCLAGGGVL